jgi:hypothetical protein
MCLFPNGKKRKKFHGGAKQAWRLKQLCCVEGQNEGATTKENFGTLSIHLQLQLHLELCQLQLFLHLKCKIIAFCRIRRTMHLLYYFYLSKLKLYCILLIKMIQPIVGEFCKTSLKPRILLEHYSCWTTTTFYAWRKVVWLLNLCATSKKWLHF